ncbi:TonB-dependent receptor [Kordia sp. TARA_039_SRF]|nr:TonB-dependent receptor [Kordia sp. TARA_039_SRF]
MKQLNYLKLLFVTLFCTVSYAKMTAQTGIVSGIITDENGLYVPGANVYIEDIKKGAISDFNGRFTLVQVPEGDYELKITFMGYADTTENITVTAGKTTTVNIVMKPDETVLDQVTISTSIGGEAKALNKQKTNLNITNVISTDQIGKFPDANIGDAIKRVAGVTMQVDQGEARNVIVRGLSPQLNSVTLNGSRIPSAEGDNRNVQMDLIPSDMIQTIEVNKAVTPDMDADALGGSVNLVTRTAPQSFRLSATVGSGINFINDKRILNGSFLLGDRSKDKKFGWMIAASINDSDFGSDNFEADWDNEFEYNTGVQDTDGEDIIDEVAVNPYVKEFQIRKYLVQRIRRSFSANLDYQLNDNNQLYFKSMYNWRDDRENRFRLQQEIKDGEDIAIGEFTITNNNLVRFPVDVKRETKGGIDNDRNKNRRLEDQRMQNYTIGGNHIFGNVKADWMASYAKASEERLNERYVAFEYDGSNPIIINNDISDLEFPNYTPENAAIASNFSDYVLDELSEQNQYTDEKDVNIFTNFELPLQLFKAESGFLKFGLRTRLKEKQRDNNFFEFKDVFENIYPTMASVDTRDYSQNDFLAGSQYQAGVFTTPQWLGNVSLNPNAADVEIVYDEFLGENFTAKEDVFAGYIMTQQKLTDKLTVMTGVRVENTNITTTGNIVEYNEDGDYDSHTAITEENSYTNILPGLHLKYNLTPNTIFRFAYTNTIARPNYVDLVPYRNIIREDEEIEVGNPNLDPAKSMNFDVAAEHYFKNVGLISGGVFYKSITDFAYTSVITTTDDTYGAGTTDFDVKLPKNGDDASVFGVELAFQRKLDFLPSFAKNFNIYLNYTYLTSSADGIITNEDGDERTDMKLPNTAPNMFNGSLGYDDGKFTARISANFSDAYIDEIGENEFTDRYYDKQFFLDFNVGYAINKNLRIYADFTNLTDQPLRYYQGAKERTMQAEYYGRRLTFGLKYDLFNN